MIDARYISVYNVTQIMLAKLLRELGASSELISKEDSQEETEYRQRKREAVIIPDKRQSKLSRTHRLYNKYKIFSYRQCSTLPSFRVQYSREKEPLCIKYIVRQEYT